MGGDFYAFGCPWPLKGRGTMASGPTTSVSDRFLVSSSASSLPREPLGLLIHCRRQPWSPVQRMLKLTYYWNSNYVWNCHISETLLLMRETVSCNLRNPFKSQLSSRIKIITKKNDFFANWHMENDLMINNTKRFLCCLMSNDVRLLTTLRYGVTKVTIGWLVTDGPRFVFKSRHAVMRGPL